MATTGRWGRGHQHRWETRSTLVTSQDPVDLWHERIGEPTLADAILDRLVHNAYTITLKGDSMRKSRLDSFRAEE